MDTSRGSDAIATTRARLARLDATPVRLGRGRAFAARRGAVLDATIRALAPGVMERTAVAALGGYGRSELTPASDLDILILAEPDAEEEAARVAEAVFYPLWDAGFDVGHAVRTPGESVFEAHRRLDSLTALLSARLVAGQALLVDMARAAAVDAVRSDRARFLAALGASREEREARVDRLGRSQEPDLKEAPGGLRDVQRAAWLAQAAGTGPDVEAAATLDEGLDLILAVRVALYRVTGSREARLLATHQEAVAGLLGIPGEPGWEPRDVLMRTIARTGRAVARAVDGLLAQAGGAASDGDRAGGGAAGDPEVSALVASVRRGWRPAAAEAFVRLLVDGRAGTVVGALQDEGLIQTLVPEWMDVWGRPQHDPYHRFPVDVHLVETAESVARLLREPSDPFTERAAAHVRDPAALVLGALLHDIGKVGRGSHVPVGAAAAERVLSRVGIDRERRERALFLVREHLLLSDTATRRNLEDEDLVVHVAARVGDRERLGMLSLLTSADAQATGPSAATSWRTALVQELAAKVDRAFERGLMDPDRAAAVGRAEAGIRRALTAAGRSEQDVERFLEAVPPAYALWVEPARVAEHVPLVLPPPDPAEARVHIGPGRSSGGSSVAIGASDRLGLLATIAGAFAVSGISILSARAFTTADGVALDAFDVRSAFEEDGIVEDRWSRFRSLLSEALAGRVDLSARVREWRSHYRPPWHDVPIEVRVPEDASDFFTVVEVHAADRLGLLFDLAGAFASLHLDVHVAQVATYGPRVVDVFYVTEQTGGPVREAERLEAMRAALAAAAGAEPSEPAEP